jgi:hypothetical protein
MSCPHTDAEHEAASALATTTFATFNRVAKERDLCLGACHVSLLIEVMEEMASHTEAPAQFVDIVVKAMYMATSFRVTKIEGVVECSDDASVH